MDQIRVDGPVADEDSSAFWLGLRDHKIVLQHCRTCDRTRFPPMPTCPYCASRDWSTIESAGDGVVYSYVEVRYPLDPRFAGEVPYVLALVELGEGPRIVARIEGEADFGVAVRSRFFDHADWTELRFVPSAI